jgi:lipoyl-dependent peroxiredoxin
MAGATKTANVTWNGDLMGGSGTITSVGSGAFSDLGVTWKTRTESEDLTSPEELLAAANAACFAMALSGALARGGNAPQKLDITAKCTFSVGDGGAKVSNMDLSVRGTVPGIDQAAFEKAAEEAGNNCPVSTALKASVEYSVKAELVG